MVPVTANQGDKVLGKVEISSPMEQVSEFFAGIDKSLIRLVEFAKKSFQLEEKDSQRESLERQDTDDKEEGVDNKSMLDSLKESFASLGDAFGQVSIGEKLGAALLVGSLLLFSQVQDALVAVLTPVGAVVQKLVDIFGAKGVFLTFLGAIVAIKFAPLITGAFAVAKKLAPGLWKGVGIAFDAVSFAIKGLATGAKSALKGLGGLGGGLTGIRGGVDLRGDTGFDTFRRSTSFANFLQRQRDKRARETAAMRGSVKDLQSRIDRGDFGGPSDGGGGFSGEGGYGSSAERGGALHG